MSGQRVSVLNTGDMYYLAQFGGSLCGEETIFADVARNFWVTGSTEPDAPTLSTQFLPSAIGNNFVSAGVDSAAPTEGTFTLNARREAGGLPPILFTPSCEIVIYEVTGKCQDIEDHTIEAWDMIIVRHGRRNGSISFADGSGTANVDNLIDTRAFLSVSQFVLGRLEFSIVEFAAAPVVDLTYFGDSQCIADCDDPQIGNERIAKLTHNVFTAGQNPVIQYSLDAGSTFNQLTLDIDALVTGGTVDMANVAAVSIDRVGSRLMVTLQVANAADADTQLASGYVLIPIASLDPCAPAGCTTTPVHVPAFNFDATVSAQPTDVYATTRCTFWAGMNGNVYIGNRLTEGNVSLTHDPASTALVSNVDFTRIHGCLGTIVAVGAENVDGQAGTSANGVIYTDNRGKLWQSATNPPGWGAAGYAITALFVRSERNWMIGTSDGQLIRTCDAGCTWEVICTIPSGNPIDDIFFANDQVGYAAFEAADGTMVIAWTIDGGTTWGKDTCSTRINTAFCDRVATAQLSQNHGYRLAGPIVNDVFTSVNYIALGGARVSGNGCCVIGSPVFSSGQCPA